jgi:ribosomal protein L34
MPIVTINDLRAKSASKRGKKMGIATVNDGEYLQLGKGCEFIESKMRKAEKQVRSKVILVAIEGFLTRQRTKTGTSAISARKTLTKASRKPELRRK